MKSKLFKDLKGGIDLYYVWIYQAYHDITAKYKRTVLGSFWIAGSMLITSVSMAIIFGALFHQSLHEILPYIVAGMLVFGMASYVFFDGAEVFMSSAGIIKNHAYPYSFFAFHTVCKSFFMFLHNLIVYWAVAALVGALCFPHWSILLALPVLLVFMFTWGMMAGMLAARFRDMRFLLPYLGQLFSMLTPIFWKTDTMKGPALLLVNLNPINAMVQIVRSPLLGKMATQTEWVTAIAYTSLGLLLWLVVFGSFRRRIPFWV